MAEKILEVCVDSPDDLKAAILNGADRIELCQALELGGLTPSAGLMAAARTASVPIHAMIRPRAGNFSYSPEEIEVMCADIAAAKMHGLSGVVFGALTPHGQFATRDLQKLLSASAGLATTLHRAFDVMAEPIEAVIDQAIALGFDRILTSGRADSAIEGIALLKRAFANAKGRIVIMPGAGLRPDNLPQLLAEVPAREVHASCSIEIPQHVGPEMTPGFTSTARKRVDPDQLNRMKKILNARP